MAARITDPERRKALGADFKARYEAGGTIRSIAIETGHTFFRVRTLLIEVGAKMRPAGRNKRASTWTPCP